MSFESPACTTNLRTFDTIKCKYCIALNPSMDSFDNLRMTPLALYSLTAVFITLGYVRCQDLKKSFDSPDQLVMVIRAPPETQMQVSEPSKVRALKWHSFFETCMLRLWDFSHDVFIFVHMSPGLPGVPEEHAGSNRRLPLSRRQLRCLQSCDWKQSIETQCWPLPGPTHHTTHRPITSQNIIINKCCGSEFVITSVHVIHSDSRLPAGPLITGVRWWLRWVFTFDSK